MPKGKPFSIPNPLAEHAPDLLQRLTEFRGQVYDMLLDQLEAATLHDPAFRRDRCPHPAEEVRVTVHILRVLTKDAWDSDDLRLLDECWRPATRTDHFAEEFEAERHRLQHWIEAARKELRPSHRQASLF